MKHPKLSIWLAVAVIAVVCLGLPLLLFPTLRGHTVLERNTPFAIYVIYAMPVLAAIVSVLSMRQFSRPALWLSLVVELSVLLLVLLSKGALNWILNLPFFSALLTFAFLSIPAIFVFIVQLVVWAAFLNKESRF